jgi:hypothetical protein
VRASLGRPSIYLLLAIMGASSALAGACSQRSVPQARARPRTAPSMIEPSRCDTASTIEVPGSSNIFGAGIADPPAPAGGGAGTAPPCVSFPSTVTSIFIRASGRVDFLTRNEDDDVHFHRCVGGPPQIIAPPEGPDGETTWSCAASPEATSFAPKPLSIPAVGSISGISSADGGGYLIGVFLADAVPAEPPPASLDFTTDRDFA